MERKRSMTHRTRALLVLVVVAVAPLALYAVTLRREVVNRLSEQYRLRVGALVSVFDEDLAQRSAEIADRLTSLRTAVTEDNRFRLGAVQGDADERSYLIDYAENALNVVGLSVLLIQDANGRIVSSGHFRNEYDREEPALPRLLAAVPGGVALVGFRTPDDPILALARADSFRVAGARFTLVGGVAVGPRFLRRLARDQDLEVRLVFPGGVLESDDPLTTQRLDVSPHPGAVVDEREVPFIELDGRGGGAIQTARLVVTHPTAALDQVVRGMDRWFLLAAVIACGIAAGLALWLSAQLSRPLARLAEKTSRVDFDRLDVDFASDRNDEVGTLSRLLGAMTARLRAGAAKLREAERRATVGDLARQVNHDIKNGLTPIRNVFRHLTQVAEGEPDELATVFGQRRSTIDSSIDYLENLATNYARLYPRLQTTDCDVNVVIGHVVGSAADHDQPVRCRLAGSLPPVSTDPLILRRIIENLLTNAVDSLDTPGDRVLISSSRPGMDPIVRITIEDSGSGMTEDQLEHAFDELYTTKERGTGLGLAIVRRLVLDLGGRLRVETEPGVGTRFTIDLPVAGPAQPSPSDTREET